MFIIKIIFRLIFFVTKIIIFGAFSLFVPLIILYGTYLNAEPVKAINAPDLVTIPLPAHSIARGNIISEADLIQQDIASHLVNDMIAQDIMQLIGQEARRTLYKNKPILLRDIGAVTTIRRNDSVTLRFAKGTMILQTVGRALENGGAGDVIKVMNEQSKKIVSGRITKNGEVDVSL